MDSSTAVGVLWVIEGHLKKSKFGLREDCDVMIDQVRAIDNKRLVKRIGEVDRNAGAKIRENLKIVLDLD